MADATEVPSHGHAGEWPTGRWAFACLTLWTLEAVQAVADAEAHLLWRLYAAGCVLAWSLALLPGFVRAEARRRRGTSGGRHARPR